MISRIANSLGHTLGRWLSRPSHEHSTSIPTTSELLAKTLEPCDVLLVEGNTRVSIAIKYLTQSTWSHAALYIGQETSRTGLEADSLCFVEADIIEGVRLVGFSEFSGLHCRVCRPVGLTPTDRARIIEVARSSIGYQYDLKNVIDLARYLLPIPPVPIRWRRRMLAFGSGDPTRAICSTLIAQCFQSVRYPILPVIDTESAGRKDCPECTREIMSVRHHSLFVPRDFDVSPYFEVIKPTLHNDFDYTQLNWSHQSDTKP